MVIKRKRLDFDAHSDELYEKSDFKQRRSHAFAKKALKDNRPSFNFAVDAEGRYTNDASE